MTNKEKEEIKKMREDGKSYSQITAILNINENTIKAYCRRNNLATIEINKPMDEKKIYTSCKNCGKPLIQSTKGQPKKFCSEECRRMWWKANDSKLLKKAYYTITCEGCGNKFESYGNKSRKFCSHACYIKSRFKKEENFNDSRAI